MEKGIDIDDLVEAYEREHGTQAFVKARQEIARCLYGEGPETFTRLRLAAGKCVRHIATETGLAEEDVVQARFDLTDEGLTTRLAGSVNVSVEALVLAVRNEREARAAAKTDFSRHPLAPVFK
jgi:hypothetical protein